MPDIIVPNPTIQEPFARRVFPTLSGLGEADLHLLEAQVDGTLRHLLMLAAQGRSGQLGGNSPNPALLTQGFWQNGFRVRPGGGYDVTVSAGVGFQITNSQPTDINGFKSLNDLSVCKPLVMMSEVTIGLPPADPSFGRIDLIEVRANSIFRDSESYPYLASTVTKNYTTGSTARTLSSLIKSTDVGYVSAPDDSTAVLGYKSGESGGPVAPDVTDGYAPLAYVYVPAAFSGTVLVQHISDLRRVFGAPCVDIQVSKAAGTAGAVTDVAYSFAPGIEVYVSDGTTSAAGAADYDIYVLGAGARRIIDLLGDNFVLPVQVTTSGSTFSPRIVNAYAVCVAHALAGTDIGKLAFAFGGGRLLSSTLGECAIRVTVYHSEYDGAVRTFDIADDIVDSIHIPLPVV